MKRTRQHVLEDESRQALKNLLPSQWLKEDIKLDYGIDMQVTIVNGEDVTNKVFAVQIKATDSRVNIERETTLSIKTKNLIYYEKYPLPVFIFYYLKEYNTFYYVFAQKYIKERLPVYSPNWRKQKNISITFTEDNRFENIEKIESHVIESIFFVTLDRLGIDKKNAVYWIDGIPKSDNQELKSLTLKALQLTKENRFNLAINTFENILKICSMTPSEKIAILVSLGNAYDCLSKFDEALDNYKTAKQLLSKIEKEEKLNGMAPIFAGIGLVYMSKCFYAESIEYNRKALRVFRRTKRPDGEAAVLNNLGNTYRKKGELTKALYNLRLALKIHKSRQDGRGQAIVLGNIGNIFNEKENLTRALYYYDLALEKHREFKNRVAEANILGSLGIINGKKGNFTSSISYLRKAQVIFRSIGDLQGQSTNYLNLANVYSDKRKFTIALRYIDKAMEISKNLDDNHGMAMCYANLGSLYLNNGQLNYALQYYRLAKEIFEKIGETNMLKQLEQEISQLILLKNRILNGIRQ